MLTRKLTFGDKFRAWPWAVAVVFGLLLHCFPAENANADIAQSPLFLTVEVAPNIVFVIDDSGSMMFETIPETITDTFQTSVYYMFPRTYSSKDANTWNIYGASKDYWAGGSSRAVPKFDATNKWAAYFRSSHNNPMYYNPAVRYQPWVDKDGAPWVDAVPSAAYHNPAITSKGTRNLTADNTQTACWIKSTAVKGGSDICEDNSSSKSVTFWPATYFKYNGSGSLTDASSYQRVEIRDNGDSYAGGPNRLDCADPNACTYEEEIQNFANWYSYHRSRVSTARAGIGRAFADQGETIRVGFGAINAGSKTLDGATSPGTLIRGVRDFSGADREEFFSLLYGLEIEAAGTPLRRGLDDVGQYYRRTGSQGPWSTTPGVSGGEDLACRSCYTLLMTDGYWSHDTSNTYTARDSVRRANVDNTNGPVINNPVPLSPNYQYLRPRPYRDDYSNTLADVAMYYWNRDLRTDIPNKVPTSAVDEAFWQHMVTFGIGFGVIGSLDPATDLPDLTSGAKSWPNPVNTNSDPAKIDDLWHASLNSRGDFFSATEPDLFAQKMGDMIAALVDRRIGSAAAIATNSTRLVDTTLIYQARFDSSDWSGEIIAYKINSDGSIGDVGWTTSLEGKIPVHGSRQVFTWNGAAGAEFAWANLSAAQKTALQAGGTEQQGIDRLNWIRGDQSKESNKTDGYLRIRTKILGDIVNSDPVVIGAPDFQYEKLPVGTAGQSTYDDFQTGNKSRAKTLYIGGNDGMLHAFDALTGVEKFAYIPSLVFNNLASLTSPDYVHRYFVDGSAYFGDAFYEDTTGGTSAWKTVMVGTLGGGGRGVFALDITNPDGFDAGKVLWEFTDPDLGYVMGQPMVVRMQNGKWAAVFGNGYASDNSKAFLFIVDLWTGALIRKIDTGAGSAASPNGLGVPALLANANKSIDYAYAGDLLGNLWKFDLTNSDASKWTIGYKSGSTGIPLFMARRPATQVQPITSPLEIGKHPEGGYMIYFGTGKYFETDDNLVSATTPIQSFYGIWDNEKTAITVTDRSSLQQQTILYEGLFSEDSEDLVRVTSSNTIDWKTKRGWYIDLVSPAGTIEGERVVSAPLLRHGRVIFTTVIPLNDPCAAGGTSWLMELMAESGSRPTYSVFDMDEDGKINSADMVTVTIGGEEVTVAVSGDKSDVGIIKTPAVITAGDGVEYKYTGGSEGGIAVIREKGSDNDQFGRRSWRQLR
ncbi:MAG: pilus assembly protein PilY [Deltaproteobacteria bacterium]|nr:pilus assembly protein PilY [Deltaproteobacteria bacterium]